MQHDYWDVMSRYKLNYAKTNFRTKLHKSYKYYLTKHSKCGIWVYCQVIYMSFVIKESESLKCFTVSLYKKKKKLCYPEDLLWNWLVSMSIIRKIWVFSLSSQGQCSATFAATKNNSHSLKSERLQINLRNKIIAKESSVNMATRVFDYRNKPNFWHWFRLLSLTLS